MMTNNLLFVKHQFVTYSNKKSIKSLHAIIRLYSYLS